MPLASVRGEARLAVSPDLVRMSGSLSAAGDDKAAALQAAATVLRGLTDDLGRSGGAPLSADTTRHPLTWSAHASTTQPEHALDAAAERWLPTGRVQADVALSVVLRDLSRGDSLAAVLAGHAAFTVHDVMWAVDADNPAWARVRADAIQDALRKGHDYAAALGGTLEGIEHLADAGLLGWGSDEAVWASARAGGMEQQSGGGGFGAPGGVPSLDPVPQLLVAVVEARFTASGAQLRGT